MERIGINSIPPDLVIDPEIFGKIINRGVITSRRKLKVIKTRLGVDYITWETLRKELKVK